MKKTSLAASLTAAASTLAPIAGDAPGAQHSFRPGEVWLDTSGKPIQAHAGAIIVVDDVYYWYGENKEFTTGDLKVWTWGIRGYRSKDLYNWEDLGLIIPPVTDDPASPLHPAKFIDRPHIIYNPRTKKFVCWLKIMDEPMQTRTVLTADRIIGPYEIVRTGLRPLGMSAGDYDVVASHDDGKAYMFFERVHSEMICADLDDDYAAFTGYYSTHLPRPGPPTVREGITYFRRQGKHYVLSSGTTGYLPNPSEVAAADSYHGPWFTLGDLHPTDRSRTSFNSQIGSVFKHPKKKDLYIALADRWIPGLAGPEFESGALSADAQNAFRKWCAEPREPLTESEAAVFGKMGTLDTNTSQSRYVWLPIKFVDGGPCIEWRSEWTLDEFE